MPYAVLYAPEPTRPGSGPEPGTVCLLNYLCNDSPWADVLNSLGIYNPRDICGNQWPNWKCLGSQHASGRAGDAGCPVDRPNGHPQAREAALWLVENHAALGVQEVIFAARRWDNQTREWEAYTGRSDHFDHVHFAQNTAGAAGLTHDQIAEVAPKEGFLAALTEAEQREILTHLRHLDPFPPERLNSVGEKVSTGGAMASRTIRWAAESLKKLRQL